MTKLNTAVLGASGYTGVEAVRLISSHPKLNLTTLTANRYAGQAYENVYPHIGSGFPPLVKWQDVNWDKTDVVFACLPHGASEEVVSKISRKGLKIIDLSADFRIKDKNVYDKTYERKHASPELLQESVYGLSEFYREEIKGADLVACPGCYPTASLLALIPALDFINTDNIIIDAKSGVSGAGRKAVQGLIYPEVAEGAYAYAIGNHRHGPEIDERLSIAGKKQIKASFTPHLLPMNRGMIITCYVELNQGVDLSDLRDSFKKRYKDEPFVHLEDEGIIPHTHYVRGSNHCRIGIFSDRCANRAIIVSVIDNLVKGSSGQAVQNLNIMMGFDEIIGLEQKPLFP